MRNQKARARNLPYETGVICPRTLEPHGAPTSPASRSPRLTRKKRKAAPSALHNATHEVFGYIYNLAFAPPPCILVPPPLPSCCTRGRKRGRLQTGTSVKKLGGTGRISPVNVTPTLPSPYPFTPPSQFHEKERFSCEMFLSAYLELAWRDGLVLR